MTQVPATAKDAVKILTGTCALCGGDFPANRVNRRFCSDKCNKIFHKNEEVKRAALDLFVRAIEAILRGDIR